MRLFVAAELPVAVTGELAAWAADAVDGDPALRLVDVGSLHLTLAFLGERPADDVAAIAGAVDAAVDGGAWPAGLVVGDALWLAPRKPHVLTVALSDPQEALTALQARVVAELGRAIGFEAEQRRFRPHVTVARVRRGRTPRAYDLVALPALEPFALEAVTLMRSHLGGPGARYEALHRVTGAPG